MSVSDVVPLARCRLDGSGSSETLRYVPLGELGLWRHLMETRHRRWVTVESVSIWLSEERALRNGGLSAEELEPVVRLRLDSQGPQGVLVPVERFFPAETYPQARGALITHFGVAMMSGASEVPGYFVLSSSRGVA